MKTSLHDQAAPASPNRTKASSWDLWLRYLIPASILLLAVCVFWALMQQGKDADTPPPKKQVLRTQILEVQSGDYQVWVPSQGMITPHTEIPLQAEVNGSIESLEEVFESGASFKKGDLLVSMVRHDYQNAVDMTKARLLMMEASLELAAANHERNQKVVADSLIPQAEVDLSLANLRQAEAAFKIAQSEYKQSMKDLERTHIRAPFDGRVRDRLVGVGQQIGPGTTLGRIYATDVAEVRLPISTRELPFVDLPERENDPPVKVILRDALDPDNPHRWEAVIMRCDGMLNEDSLEVHAIASIEDPFGQAGLRQTLRMGQPVSAAIMGKRLTNVVALPRKAIRELDQIYLVDPMTHMLSKHRISPIWRDEVSVIVRDPMLPDGQWVATTHLVYAPDGTKVEVIPDLSDDQEKSKETLASDK